MISFYSGEQSQPFQHAAVITEAVSHSSVVSFQFPQLAGFPVFQHGSAGGGQSEPKVTKLIIKISIVATILLFICTLILLLFKVKNKLITLNTEIRKYDASIKKIILRLF